MINPSYFWDLEDDPDGNYWHIVVEGHGITREDVEEVLADPDNAVAFSNSAGRPITFGWTLQGRHIAVVWEEVNDDPRMIYPVTAYETPPPGEK